MFYNCFIGCFIIVLYERCIHGGRNCLVLLGLDLWRLVRFRVRGVPPRSSWDHARAPACRQRCAANAYIRKRDARRQTLVGARRLHKVQSVFRRVTDITSPCLPVILASWWVWSCSALTTQLKLNKNSKEVFSIPVRVKKTPIAQTAAKRASPPQPQCQCCEHPRRGRQVL